MIRSTAVRTVAAPPDQVWGLLADHEGMSTWVPGLRVAVTRPGTSETGGVGTVRRVGFGIAGPFGEALLVRGLASGLLSGLVRGVRAGGERQTATG